MHHSCGDEGAKVTSGGQTGKGGIVPFKSEVRIRTGETGRGGGVQLAGVSRREGRGGRRGSDAVLLLDGLLGLELAIDDAADGENAEGGVAVFVEAPAS